MYNEEKWQEQIMVHKKINIKKIIMLLDVFI